MSRGVIMCSLVLLTLLAVQSAGIKQKVTPVEKVISLLEKLKGETAAEGKDEAASYDKFACFCKEQADNKLYAITKSEDLIKQQTAKIKLLASEIDELNAAISDLKKKKAKLEGEQKEAQAARAKEHEAYAVEEKDMADAIAAIKGAIEALQESKEQMTDAKLDLAQRKVAAVRAHISRPSLEKVAAAAAAKAKAVLSLLDEMAPGKPAAYEYHSNDIIATLKGLLKTFKADKYELDTEEAEKQNDYEMEAQARANTIKFADMDIQEKAKLSADKENEKAKTEQEKEEETADMEADQGFMKKLTEECEQKAKDFDQRSKTRSAELTALSEAIEILKSGVQPNYSANKKLVLASKDTRATGHWVWVQDQIAPVKVAAAAVHESAHAPS